MTYTLTASLLHAHRECGAGIPGKAEFETQGLLFIDGKVQQSQFPENTHKLIGNHNKKELWQKAKHLYNMLTFRCPSCR